MATRSFRKFIAAPVARSTCLEGTIYPALHRLEQAGLLASRWTTAESGRQRRVYTLTKRGERGLADQGAVWRRFAGAIGDLLGQSDQGYARRGR